MGRACLRAPGNPHHPTVITKRSAPTALMFADDGSIPNNPRLPFLFYRGAIDLAGTPDPEAVIERAFASHGWGNNMWRNGISTYVHYHSMIYEALGIARGRAKVRFGGGRQSDRRRSWRRRGPAGRNRPSVPVTNDRTGGGRRLSQEREIRPLPRQPGGNAKALKSIPEVPLPDSDPVLGPDGPLVELWRG